MLVVHFANRMELLRDALVASLRQQPLPPLAAQPILVHSNGMAQWLRLAIASAEGIAAGLTFPMPASFLWQTTRALLGPEVPAHSPYAKDHLLWHLYALLPTLDQPLFQPLHAYLQVDDNPQLRRYQLAARLADLFDQYLNYRGDWILDWEQGGNQAAATSPWQPALWRLLCQRIGDGPLLHRARCQQRFVQLLSQPQPPAAELPPRILLFGLSSMPLPHLQMLQALANHSQVELFVLNPCCQYWGELADERSVLRRYFGELKRSGKAPASADLHIEGNPLLASWGRQGRDFIYALYRAEEQGLAELYEYPDDYDDGSEAPLLAQLQQLIRDNEEIPPRPFIGGDPEPRQLRSDDQSLVVTVAHSPLREIEILHDQLLDRFAANPELRPQDLIVMVPEIDSYAPLIEAVFGRFDRQDPRYIPFTIADRHERHHNPLLDAFLGLLTLPDGRFPLSAVLDLLALEAVQQRFGLTASDLPTLERWLRDAGVRWGRDSDHRQALGLPLGPLHSWRFGLERMLLGYALGDVDEWQQIAPYAEVAGLEAALAGQLAELFRVLDQFCQQASEPLTASGWQHLLDRLLEQLFVANGDDDERTLSQIHQAVGDWLAAVDLDNPDHNSLPLPLAVVQATLSEALTDSRRSPRFLAGCVNFCTLMPMRAIPFQLVCLLGMEDGAYPRPVIGSDFDLMAHDYRPGDRARRDDDRYLLLEALLSARRQLYISYVGRSAQDNSPHPPSVLVAELLDRIAQGWRPATVEAEAGDPAAAIRRQLLTEHPLQPFSARYFQQDQRLFSYAHEWLNGAAPPLPSGPQPTPAGDDEPIRIDDLQRFLRQPLERYYRDRLGVRLYGLAELPSDDEPFSLNALQSYQMRHTALKAVRINQPQSELAAHLSHAGLLPHGAAGELTLAPLYSDAQACWQERCLHLGRGDEQPLAVPALTTSAGTIAATTLSVVSNDSQPTLVRLMPRPFATKPPRLQDLLPLWLEQLLLAAAGNPISALLCASDGSQRLNPLPQPQALQQLATIIAAYQAAAQQPPALAIKSAFALLLAKDRETGLKAARTTYLGRDDGSAGERDHEPMLKRSWPSFEALVEGGFADAAETLYYPLIQQWLSSNVEQP